MGFIQAREGFQKLYVVAFVLRASWSKFWDTYRKFSHAHAQSQNALYLNRGIFSEVATIDFYSQDIRAEILSSISKIFPRPRTPPHFGKCPLSKQGNVFRSCVYRLLYSGHHGRNFEILLVVRSESATGPVLLHRRAIT